MLKDDCVTKIYGQLTFGDEARFICWKMARIFAAFKHCSGIKVAKQRHILTDKQTNFDNLKNTYNGTYNENLAS